MTTRVTIAMPVRDVGSWIDEAVASILAQTFRDWELLVVDDGSTDGTAARARRFDDPRIRVISDGRRRGLPARLNQAIDLARTEFFARMDGDDVSYPERLERQLAWLDANPTCDLVATHLLVVDPSESVLGTVRRRGARHEDIVRRPWSGFHMNHATWVGRTDWFRLHRYREGARRTEDDDLLLRAYRTSRFHRLDDILYAYRVGPLRVGPILTARRHFVTSLARQALQGNDPKLLAGIPLQAAKAAFDAAAIWSGAGLRALRHRAEPVEEAEGTRWEGVRRTVADELARAAGMDDGPRAEVADDRSRAACAEDGPRAACAEDGPRAADTGPGAPFGRASGPFWDAYHSADHLPHVPDPVPEGRSLRALTRPYDVEMLFRRVYDPLMPHGPEHRVLEIGSAPGIHLVQLHRRYGVTPCGVEYSTPGAALNRRLFEAHGLDASLVEEADFFDDAWLAPHAGEYSAVLSRGFLEHYDDPAAVVERHARLVRPGGLLVVTIPNLGGVAGTRLRRSDPELLALHNTRIMSAAAFPALFDRAYLEPVFCGPLGVASVERLGPRRGSGGPGWNVRAQMALAVPLRLLFRGGGPESAAWSPHWVWAGRRRPA